MCVFLNDAGVAKLSMNEKNPRNETKELSSFKKVFKK
jgi:hypothetical protein